MYKILIVEDELIAAEYLKEVLNSNGFEVIRIIDNGLEAIRNIPNLKPDIVLMDIMLKDSISGDEVASKLRQTASDIAVIFLTAFADAEMLEYTAESNIYGYIMKPYNENAILNTLVNVSNRLMQEADNRY